MGFVTFMLIFLLALLVSVAAHEWGHLRTARKAGLAVESVNIGFGRVLASKTGKNGTVYALRAIPAGGYVKIPDFEKTRPATLFRVASAGIVVNALLAVGAVVMLGVVAGFIHNPAGVPYQVTYQTPAGSTSSAIRIPDEWVAGSMTNLVEKSSNGENVYPIISLVKTPDTSWGSYQFDRTLAVVKNTVSVFNPLAPVLVNPVEKGETAPSGAQLFYILSLAMFAVNISLAVFNLIPAPLLDGSIMVRAAVDAVVARKPQLQLATQRGYTTIVVLGALGAIGMFIGTLLP